MGQNPNRLKFNVLTSRELSFIFGGKPFNHIKILENDTEKFKEFAKARNDMITYYTYARSLKTRPEDFIKFLTTRYSSNNYSMENPHNQAHDDQGNIMNDANFSITNPIFFAYHSFI